MSGVSITGLNPASTLTGSEIVPIVQSGTTVRTTLAAMPYVPAGTGAVTTTVQAKLRETVSVKDFGAVGDGTTDDTAAIQAAITAVSYVTTGYLGEATGKALYFPAGVYKISSPLTVAVNAGVSFVGDDKTKSTIWQSTSDTNCFNLTGNNYRGMFYKIRLAGNAGQVGGVSKAISITPNGNQIDVQDCWINNFGYGISGVPTSDSTFTNNTMEYVATPINITSAGCLGINISNNSFYDCGPVALGAASYRAMFIFSDISNLIFSNNRITCDTAMSPQDNGVFTFTNITGCDFSNNQFYGTNYLGINFNFDTVNKLKFNNNSLPSPYRQQIKMAGCSDVVISGNTMPIVQSPGTIAVNMVDITTSSAIRISNNWFGEATLNIIGISSTCATVNISNNIFDGGTQQSLYQPIQIQGTTAAEVIGNIFKSGASNTKDFSADTTTKLVFANNILDKGYYIDPAVAPASVFGNVGSGNRTWITAAPIYGTWAVGDKVFFETPTSGGYIGAVCTVAGTPGTWKTFGLIS
jgi:hypothetical protein